MIYLIREKYEPNTAAQNRFEAFINAFNEKGIMVTVVFIRPNMRSDIWRNNLKYTRVFYLWKRRINKYADFLLSLLNIKSFVKILKSEDRIILFGAGQYLRFFVNNSYSIIYHEQTEHPEVNRRMSIIDNWLYKSYLRSCCKLEGLFVISKALKIYYISIGVPSNKIHIINIVVDTSRFLNLKKENIKHKYISYCGTISNAKDGVDDLIKAFSIVSSRHSDINLYIIGDILSIKENNRNLDTINKLGISNKVVFTGIQSASKVPQILKNSEVCVLARPNNLQSEHGFPTKLGEYLLTGNPVVVTRTSDIQLFLIDGESALLVNPSDIDELANKICWALEHPVQSSVIGQKGSSIAKCYFNSLIEVEKYINVLQTNC